MKYLFMFFLSMSLNYCSNDQQKDKIVDELPKVTPSPEMLKDKEDCDEKAKKQIEKVKTLDLSKGDEGCTIE